MPKAHNNIRRLVIVCICSLMFSGCSSIKFPWVYRINVQQGNILDKEDIDQLEFGMTKRQVQYVMGSPMLIDTFNQDRWTYYYSRRDGKGNTRKRQLTLHFEEDKYVRHEGDITPSNENKKVERSLNDEEAHATEQALKATEKKKKAAF